MSSRKQRRSGGRKQARNNVADTPSESLAESPIEPRSRNLWQLYRAWRKRYREKIEARRKARGPLKDWLFTIGEVVIIVFVIRTAAVEAFRIPTGSMENTLLVGDFLLVDKFTYGIRTPDWIGIPFTQIGFSIPYTRLPGISHPEPGDILVFRYPLNKRLNYIKRCIAVGGQTVEIRDKVLFVDGEKIPLPPEGKFTDPRIIPEHIQMHQIVPPGAGNKDNYGPVTVPEGHYMMMGDNRDNSADSRFWGFLPEELVLGRALIIYFSFDKHAPMYRFWEKIRWVRFFRPIR